MHVTRVVAGIVFVAVVAGACRSPSGESTDRPTASPVSSASPATPIAPAVEPTHPDAERTIPFPSEAPIAPAIEPEPTGPDPTIEFDPE